MENQPNTISSLFETAGDYIETRIDLFKLKTVDKSSDIVASIVAVLAVTLLLVLGFIIINIGICIWLGTLLGQLWYGYFVVGGFYMIVGALVLLFKNKWIKQPVSDIVVKKILN
jgi:hypothetical protein